MIAKYTQQLEWRYFANFDEDAQEFLRCVVGGMQRMKQLIDDLLLYSRASRANVAPEQCIGIARDHRRVPAGQWHDHPHPPAQRSCQSV